LRARWAQEILALIQRRALIALAVPLLLGAGGVAVASRRRRSPGGMPAVLAGVHLRDQNGAVLPPEQLSGKLLLLNFIFTRCGSVCPTQTRALSRVRRALAPSIKEQVRFVSVSLDPEHDTAQNLNDFAQNNQATDAAWSFVAASAGATQLLTQRLQLGQNPDPQPAPAGHGSSLYLFDGTGRLVQRYVGAPLDESRLVADLTRLAQLSNF
jgi:protein SCO1